MEEVNDEHIDFECPYCDFRSRTSYQIFLHECAGKLKAKKFKKQAIKFGQKLGVGVGVSV